MRWYVSIGAVLVAAVMAGGVAAGIAAPNTRNQLADAKDNNWRTPRTIRRPSMSN